MKKDTMVIQKFIGSKGWLWFWIIICFPVGIVYYFLKRSPVEVKILKE